MLTVAPLGLALPPLAVPVATEQLMGPSVQPVTVDSVMVYVVRFVRLVKHWVFVFEVVTQSPGVPPVSVSEKAASGAGLAVKLKLCELSGTASLMILIEPGKTTAPAERLRSWAPPTPSRETRLVWYGDPEIETEELPRPQSGRLEMCPPQARIAVDEFAVKLTTMLMELSPEYAALT